MNKTLYYLLLATLSSTMMYSCKNNVQEEKASQNPSDTNTITPLHEVLIASSNTIADNETLSADDYPIRINPDTFKVNKGKYIDKSTNQKYINTPNTIVEPENIRDTSYLNSPRYMYLAIKQPIALFSKMHPTSEGDVIGILDEPSFAIVDSVFYNGYYNEEGVEGKFPITFDLWYAIRINGHSYYTDFKPHDFQAYRANISHKNQIFMIYAESTGYDEDPDRGYPEYFTAIVIGKDNQNAWKIISTPTLLVFFPEGEEYFDSNWLNYQINNNGDFILQAVEEYTEDHSPIWKDVIKWNGKNFTKLY